MQVTALSSLSAISQMGPKVGQESLKSMQERLKRIRWKQDRLLSMSPRGSPGHLGDLVTQMQNEVIEFVGEILLNSDKKAVEVKKYCDYHTLAKAIKYQQLRAEVINDTSSKNNNTYNFKINIILAL